MAGLPEVSLISSWHAGTPGDRGPLPGLTHALHAGLSLFDLYFLNHTEITWYAAQTGRAEGKWEEWQRQCPLCFAAALEPDEIKCIAEALLDLLVGEHYAGRLVGPRPRFAALATYWPLITDDNEDLRLLSVRAVQNSLLLAGHLGCGHVEIVGGAAFSEADGQGAMTPDEKDLCAQKVREQRFSRLCQSLCDVYCNERGHALLQATNGARLCLEMEPGSAYLIRDVQSFHEVIKGLPTLPEMEGRVLLNVDLAHMFLADADDVGGAPSHAGQRQLGYLTDPAHGLKRLIGHFHVSDHARTHASDLCPGTYHFFSPDYKPWLELAAELVGQPQFSNSVAVEMEACSDIHDALRAVGRTRAWLRAAAPSPLPGSQGVVEGVILAVDVVGSTEVLAMEGLELEEGATRLNAAISCMCRVIQGKRGSVYSFTGDGVVAIFDQCHFLNAADCALNAQLAADALFDAMKEGVSVVDEWLDREEEKLALRIALHWGRAVIPTGGPLRHQVLGADVIIGCRLMNAADCYNNKGESLSPTHRVNQIASAPFRLQLGAQQQALWSEMSAMEGRFKGVHWIAFRKRVKQVYLRRENPFKP